MEDIYVDKKPSIFSKFFGILFKKKEKDATTEYQSVTKFQYFLEDLPQDDENYPALEEAVNLCDEAYRISKLRLSLADKIKALNEQLSELDCFNELSEEDAEHFKSLLSRFTSLAKESSQLMYQITSFDQSLQYMERLEQDANLSMPYIKDAERRQRMLKSDMSHLEGEKSELTYEKEVLDKGLQFIYRFSLFMVGVFSLATVLMVFLFMFRGVGIFYPTTIMVISIIILISVLYFFRRRIVFELKLNIKKQYKAIGLLNKKTAVYAHYTNFLNFVYKKYKVKNSKMLQSNLDDYSNYKHLTMRYDAIRNIMFQTEQEIELFLREKSLDSIKTSTEKFAQTINIDDKKHYYNELRENRNQLENNLSEFDSRHEEIWDLLVQLSENDKTDAHIIDQVIRTYLDEVSKIFSILDAQELDNIEDVS